jgi:hypothetical protein
MSAGSTGNHWGLWIQTFHINHDQQPSPHHTQFLDELAAEDAMFTCDVGTPTVWAARYLRMNGNRRLLGSFTHGSMANALQAIGVQASHPGRQVITLSGRWRLGDTARRRADPQATEATCESSGLQ